MRKLIFIICLIIGISISTDAQKLLKYSGKYDNGMAVPGEADYTYYKEENTFKQIKQGRFRYTVKSKANDYRFNQSFIGNYHNDLKDGEWSYRINARDYFKNKDDYYSTGSISLVSKYKQGMPQGRWEFNSALKNRKRLSNGSKIEWDRYLAEETVKIIVNFNNGLLVDSVKILTNYGYELQGVFDKNGMCDKTWIYIEKETKTITEYSHGLKKSQKVISTKDNKEISNLVYTDDMKMHSQFVTQKSKDFAFEVDTFTMLRNHKDFMVSMIYNNIFNDDYFLYRYVPGDLIYYFEAPKFVSKLKGAYILYFDNKITNSQINRLSDLDKLEKKIIDINSKAQKISKSKTLSEDANNKVSVIYINAKNAKMYTCHASFIVNEMDIKKGIEKAKVNCERKYNVKVEIPNFKSKNEAIEYFIKTLEDILVASERNYEAIK
ncbi:MAG: hypothetical protein K9J13_08730 [Saprospiraceae bacterium]|nr:hypothetical protein [Saprospiraceae bacterium]